MVRSSSPETADVAFLRKLRKPLIEKKRRDRMNVSIDNMKAILAKTSKNAASVVKMDKAEILELAVAHLSQLQQQQKPRSTSANHVTSYRAGFNECRKETIQYLRSATLTPNPLLKDLDNHLNNACDTSRQNEIPFAGRRHGFLPERRSTSSPIIDMPPAPMFGSFCRNSMFSPISSADIRGHRVHSPLDSWFSNPLSRSCSPCYISSPCTSTYSSSDSSHSDIDVFCGDSSSEFDGSAQHSESRCDIVIKQEAPWRPW